MEIDHVGTVRSSFSSKVCQTKTDVTEVDIEHKKPVETSEEKSSCILHVSSAENVGHFKNMRRECQVKSFEGLEPFSYVCRMMRFSEPNTNEFEPEEGSIYSERCVGDQHYVCVVNPDQPNLERVRGFPVEIDVEEGEHDAGENILGDDSGMFPLHLQSQIRDLIVNRHQRDLEMWLMRELLQVQVIRMTRMIRTVRIRMILLNRTSQNWRETFCFNMRAEGTGPTTVGVTPACKLVGGLQLVDVNKRQKKVDRPLSTNWLQITLSSLGGIEDFWSPSAAAAAPPSVAVPADDTMDVDLRGDDDDFLMEELVALKIIAFIGIIKVFGMSLHLLTAAWK